MEETKMTSKIKLGASKIILLLLLAFFVRMAFVLVLNPDNYYFSDTRHYDRAAVSLLDGQGLGEKYYRAPLYPVVMAAVYAVAGHSFLAMRLAECLLAVLLCWLIHRLTWQLYGARAAFWALLIAALFPHFIMLVGILYPTHLFTLLILLAFYFLLRSEKEASKLSVCVSAFFAGMAMLTVASFFFMAPFWLAWLLWRRPLKWQPALLFLVTFVLVLTPWTIRNYAKYGRLTLVQPLPHTVLPNLQDRALQEQEIASGFKTTVQYFKQHPTGTGEDALSHTVLYYLRSPWSSIKHLVAELGHFWALYPDRLDTAKSSYRADIHARDQRMETRGEYWQWIKWPSIMMMAPFFLLAVYGLGPAWVHDQRATSLFLWSVAGFSIGYSMIYAEVRYRIPLEPLIIMWAALGWERLLTAWSERKSVRAERTE